LTYANATKFVKRSRSRSIDQRHREQEKHLAEISRNLSNNFNDYGRHETHKSTFGGSKTAHTEMSNEPKIKVNLAELVKIKEMDDDDYLGGLTQ